MEKNRCSFTRLPGAMAWLEHLSSETLGALHPAIYLTSVFSGPTQGVEGTGLLEKLGHGMNVWKAEEGRTHRSWWPTGWRGTEKEAFLDNSKD